MRSYLGCGRIKQSAFLATAAMMGVAASAPAATMYVAALGTNSVDQITNAATGGSPSLNSSFISLTNAIGVTADSTSGDLSVLTYTSPGNFYGYTSSGSSIANTSGSTGSTAAPDFSTQYNGTVYASEWNNGVIYAMSENLPSPYGTASALATIPGSKGAYGMAVGQVNGSGEYLYVAQASTSPTANNIVAYSLSTSGQSATLLGTISTGTVVPLAMTTDTSGNVYFSSTASTGNKLYELTPNGLSSVGVLSTISVTSGSIGELTGMAFGPDGNLYVSDYTNGAIDQITNINLTSDMAAASSYISLGSSSTHPYGLVFAPTPEPASVGLLALAAGGMLLRRRKNS